MSDQPPPRSSRAGARPQTISSLRRAFLGKPVCLSRLMTMVRPTFSKAAFLARHGESRRGRGHVPGPRPSAERQPVSSPVRPSEGPGQDVPGAGLPIPARRSQGRSQGVQDPRDGSSCSSPGRPVRRRRERSTSCRMAVTPAPSASLSVRARMKASSAAEKPLPGRNTWRRSRRSSSDRFSNLRLWNSSWDARSAISAKL